MLAMLFPMLRVLKIRWTIGNSGKSGGVRVIYFNLDADILCLVAIYKKAEKENMSPNDIKEVIK